MIISCESCYRKFIVKDQDIPQQGRNVQCGYCSVTWHQMPVFIKTKVAKKINKNISADAIKASDGKTYRFLGSQWAQLLPSGKTGIFAKKEIGQELNKLAGKKEIKFARKKPETINPSAAAEELGKVPDVYRPKKKLGFFNYIFFIIIMIFSIVGFIKTFEDLWLSYFPEDIYVLDFLDQQLNYVVEAVKNIITIIRDLTKSY